MAYRQLGFVVGAGVDRFVHEQMPRHRADRVELALVGDRSGLLGARAQALDQAIAHALRGHADTDGLGLQAQARGHATSSRSSASSPPTQLAIWSSAW